MLDFQELELNARQEKLLETLRFLARLLAAGLVFQTILFIYPSTLGLQTGLAQLSTFLLNVVGYSATFERINILIDNQVYKITQDCLGWKSVAALLGLGFASKELKKKWRIVLLGVAVLQLSNVLRIITTIILSQNGIVSFEFIHGILWRWTLTAIVLVLWLFIVRSEQVKQVLTDLY